MSHHREQQRACSLYTLGDTCNSSIHGVSSNTYCATCVDVVELTQHGLHRMYCTLCRLDLDNYHKSCTHADYHIITLHHRQLNTITKTLDARQSINYQSRLLVAPLLSPFSRSTFLSSDSHRQAQIVNDGILHYGKSYELVQKAGDNG